MSKLSKKLDQKAAAKAKKQKLILIGGGVLLLAIAGLQGPKLLKHGGGAEAAPATTSESGGTLTPVSTTSPVGVPGTTLAPGKTVGSVAGVPLPGGATAVVATNQLASFTLFDVKDPFVQQMDLGPSAQAIVDGAIPAAGDGPIPPADPGGAPTGGSNDKPAAPQPPAPNSATIKIDGEAEQVALKGTFPSAEPTFVLVSVTKSSAKIAVSGGSFDDGQTITLKVGKKVVLVNSATNVRYVLLLVRTENAATFATDPAAGATGASGASGETGATDPTATSTP